MNINLKGGGTWQTIVAGLIILLVVFGATGFITTPSGGLIDDAVEAENERMVGAIAGEKKMDLPKPRAARKAAMRGKFFETYIYAERGDEGITRVENIDVRVPDGKLGQKVKIQIDEKESKAKSMLGNVVDVLGNANVESAGEIREGQRYKVEIIGRTPSGDRYGLIDMKRTYVIGARNIGEKIQVEILGTGTLQGGEVIIYAKKVIKKKKSES